MNGGLRGIIRQAQEDKDHLESIGDIYDGDKILIMLKEFEKEIDALKRNAANGGTRGSIAFEAGIMYACDDILLGSEVSK